MSKDPDTSSAPPTEVSAPENQLADGAPAQKGKRWRRPIMWSVGAAVVIVVGVLVGWALLGVAQFDQACGPHVRLNSWKRIDVSGLPSTLQATFGYGRGTQSIESTLSATPQRGVKLPPAIAVYAEPLATSDGTQTIPTLSNKKLRRGQRGISAVAVQIPRTSTYELEVCVRAPNAVAGLYTSQLVFPGATLSTGASLPVSVTFQSESVPFLLTVGLVPLALLGITYTTLFLIRRSEPDLKLTDLAGHMHKALFSVNGLTALIVSIGAVFTAWSTQCYRNTTFGTPWPTQLLTLVTMAGAASVASTIPMGLAKDPLGTPTNGADATAPNGGDATAPKSAGSP